MPLQRWVGGILIAVAVGHLIATVLAGGRHLRDWAADGFWSVVPFLDAGELSIGALHGAVTFWSGPGGFALPLILLGALVWHVAGRGGSVPAWMGWALAVWGTANGVLLGPSPYFVLLVPAVLLILARRQPKERDPR